MPVGQLKNLDMQQDFYNTTAEIKKLFVTMDQPGYSHTVA